MKMPKRSSTRQQQIMRTTTTIYKLQFLSWKIKNWITRSAISNYICSKNLSKPPFSFTSLFLPLTWHKICIENYLTKTKWHRLHENIIKHKAITTFFYIHKTMVVQTFPLRTHVKTICKTKMCTLSLYEHLVKVWAMGTQHNTKLVWTLIWGQKWVLCPI
jgi:hypothetical protein